MKGRIEENQRKIDKEISEADEILEFKENLLGKMKGKKEKQINDFEIAKGYNPADYKVNKNFIN